MTVNVTNRRIQISVLWISLAVMMSASMVLYLFGGGADVLDAIRAGEVEGMEITTGLSMLFALFWLVPLVMAFLTVTLPLVVNRWVNVVMGAVWAVMNGMDAVEHLGGGELGGEPLLVTVMALVGLLIAWLGFRLTKGQPSEPSQTSSPTHEHAHA
jgi:hypothetical protein